MKEIKADRNLEKFLMDEAKKSVSGMVSRKDKQGIHNLLPPRPPYRGDFVSILENHAKTQKDTEV